MYRLERARDELSLSLHHTSLDGGDFLGDVYRRTSRVDDRVTIHVNAFSVCLNGWTFGRGSSCFSPGKVQLDRNSTEKRVI